MDAHAFAGEAGFCDRPRIERTHGPLERDRVGTPVQAGFGLVQLVGIGHAGLRLRLRDRLEARAQQAQAVGQHLRAHLGETVMQLPAQLARLDRGVLAQKYRTGIQARLHLHQTDSGFGIAGLDRPLDRGGTAPARQQRGVHVPAAVGGNGQHRLGQDQPIGHHHHQVRLQVTQLLLRRFVLQRLGLEHRNAPRNRLQLHR